MRTGRGGVLGLVHPDHRLLQPDSGAVFGVVERGAVHMFSTHEKHVGRIGADVEEIVIDDDITALDEFQEHAGLAEDVLGLAQLISLSAARARGKGVQLLDHWRGEGRGTEDLAQSHLDSLKTT